MEGASGGRRDRLAAWLFRRVCVREPGPPEDEEERYDEAVESSRRFFARLGDPLPVEGRAVLDVGSGSGTTCVEAALRGAERVVGVDIQADRVELARGELARRRPDLAGRVEFVVTDGSMRELGDERFDVVLSKDSFEHYANPEEFARVMTRFVKPGGVVAVGFGPLWKGPTGGHIRYMTKLPWAHLLFPEHVIMRERRRFRPEEDADRFEDVVGGLNKMTLERFRTIMDGSELGLEPVHFATNVSGNPLVRLMDLASRIPGAREYFTANVYGIWRVPADGPG